MHRTAVHDTSIKIILLRSLNDLGRRNKVAKYKKNGYKKNYKKNYKSKKKGRTYLEKLAWNLGRIECGKNNSDSKVYASYQAGKSEPKKSVRKPLI